MTNKDYLNFTNPPPKTLPPLPPKLTVETKMVKCKVIEITEDYSDYDHDDIKKDISEWSHLTEQEYGILIRFINDGKKPKNTYYIIARQIEDIKPVLERTLALAKAKMEKHDKRENTHRKYRKT